MKRSVRSIAGRRPLMLAGFALIASALTLSFRPMPTVHAAPAPTISATVHDNWAGIDSVPPNLRYELLRHPHYTLHVTGANFVPAAIVKLALLRVDTLRVLKRGSTSAEGAYIWVPGAQRSIPNPLAGTLDYEAAVNSALQAAPLRLWSRSANQMSIDTVTRT
jgi:hypothetical protein